MKDSLNTTLFPGVPSNVEVHDGFRNEHALTASQILEEVRKLMAVHTTQSVTCVCDTSVKPLESVNIQVVDWSLTGRCIGRA